ncbi:hypothetical protein [Scytonema sp. NUACC21]
MLARCTAEDAILWFLADFGDELKVTGFKAQTDLRSHAIPYLETKWIWL